MGIRETIVDALNQRLADKHEFFRNTVRLKNLVEEDNSAFDQSFLADVFQYHTNNRGLHDIAVYGMMLSSLTDGSVYTVDVSVGGSPWGDRCVDLNQKLLDQITSPFIAKATGDRIGPDGYVKWSEQIIVDVWGKKNKIIQVVDNKKLKPASVPLEIGYIDSSIFWLRLWEYGAIARWPYGRKFLRIYFGSHKWWGKRMKALDDNFS